MSFFYLFCVFFIKENHQWPKKGGEGRSTHHAFGGDRWDPNIHTVQAQRRVHAGPVVTGGAPRGHGETPDGAMEKPRSKNFLVTTTSRK